MNKQILCALAAAGLAVSGAATTAMAAGSAAAATALKDAAWVDHQVQEVQPKPEERRLDEIGWAKDITTAEKLAKESNRPVFLFTLDGRMGTGRC